MRIQLAVVDGRGSTERAGRDMRMNLSEVAEGGELVRHRQRALRGTPVPDPPLSGRVGGRVQPRGLGPLPFFPVNYV